MKIVIYALHLGFGGVEKYVSTLANMLCEKHDVKIVSTYKIKEQPAFFIDPRVQIDYLIKDLKPNKEELLREFKSKNVIGIVKQLFIATIILLNKNFKNIKSIKSCEADIIISTRIFHNRIISKYAKNSIIKITGEHNYHNNNKKKIKNLIQSCKGFDYFIPISKYLCDFYEPKMRLIGVKTKYIKFCVDNNRIEAKRNLPGNNIISVGRLSPEKGYSDLIEVFSRIHKRNKKAKLDIIGDGPEREKLEKIIEEKKVKSSIKLHGYKDKDYVFSKMSESDIYLMTSYTESFGIVLIEAMSFGLPCVAFSSAQGALEIIENGKNGVIVQDRDKDVMVDNVCDLLDNKNCLKKFSKEATKTARTYSYDVTKHEWEEFIESLDGKAV